MSSESVLRVNIANYTLLLESEPDHARQRALKLLLSESEVALAHLLFRQQQFRVGSAS